MRLLLTLFTIILLATPLIADETASQQLWAEQVRGKQAEKILDDLDVIQMIAFTGMKGTKIDPRSAAIATVLMRTGCYSALIGPVSLQTMTKEAKQLAGRELTEKEAKNVEKYYNRCLKKYLRGNPANKSGKFRMDITFGLKDVRYLNNTIKDEKTMQNALNRLSLLHGFSGQAYASAFMSLDLLQSAMQRGIPVILQKEGTFFVCFGCFKKDDVTYLLLTLPEKMPFQVGHMQLSKEDMESIDPFVVKARRNMEKRMNGKFREDYQIKTSKQIPAEGFIVEPFEQGKYASHVLMNWKDSAAAHDTELRKILNLPEPAEIKQTKLPDNPTDKDLWNYYILKHDETLGGPYSLVPSIVIPASDNLNQQYACLTSSIAAQQGIDVGEFALSLKKFYRGACEVLNDDFLLLKDDKKQKCEELINSIKTQYDAKQKGLETTATEQSDPYLLSALKIKSTITPSANLNQALSNIEHLHGWKSLLETAQNVSYDKYKEAIHKRVPIILRDTQNNSWLLCIGYLQHDKTDMLIIVDPGKIAKGKTLHIDNQKVCPESGVYFEKFAQDRYQPYFIHDWHISVDAYKDKIKKIFAKKAASTK